MGNRVAYSAETKLIGKFVICSLNEFKPNILFKSFILFTHLFN